MKSIQKILMLTCLCVFASCSQAHPLSVCEYTHLLANIKEFFCVGIVLLGQDSDFAIGQAISRLYYGHYHLSRLLYNGIKGCDGNNHSRVWKQMPLDIRTYGETLKDLRIKYDYNATSFSRREVLQDLSYIENHKADFDKILFELKKSVSKFSNDSKFLQSVDNDVNEIASIYQDVIQKIMGILNGSE